MFYWLGYVDQVTYQPRSTPIGAEGGVDTGANHLLAHIHRDGHYGLVKME